MGMNFRFLPVSRDRLLRIVKIDLLSYHDMSNNTLTGLHQYTFGCLSKLWVGSLVTTQEIRQGNMLEPSFVGSLVDMAE